MGYRWSEDMIDSFDKTSLEEYFSRFSPMKKSCEKRYKPMTVEPKREYRIYGFSKHRIEDDYICSIFAQNIKEAYMFANDIRISWFIENYDDLDDVPDLGVELDKRNIDPDDYDRVFVLLAELAPQYTYIEIEESSNIN